MKQIILILSILLFGIQDIFGCSAFLLNSNGNCVVGFNENWKTMPGLVLINKRNIEKRSLSWHKMTMPQLENEKTVKWKSKYGSVSFSPFGIDLPCYGVNEKGLFIVELYLEETSSRPDASKANIFWAQWIQYQLDNFATVQEIIDNMNKRFVIDWWPAFPGSHFFIADKSGKTAAIEVINGTFNVITGTDMPVPALTNELYQKKLSDLKSFSFMGGTKTFGSRTKWNERFAKIAYSLELYKPTEAATDYSWKLLDNIIPGQWQLVADLKKSVVYFRTDKSTKIKFIDLSECNLTKGCFEYIEINSEYSGNVKGKLQPLTVKVNDDYISYGFPIGYPNEKFSKSQEYENIKNTMRQYCEEILRQGK